MCELEEVVASGCAISRAFPLYNQKTGSKSPCEQVVEVGFILTGPKPILPDEVQCVNALCEGVRLAQEIVDTPTNIMHTDGFLDVSIALQRYIVVGGASCE